MDLHWKSAHFCASSFEASWWNFADYFMMGAFAMLVLCFLYGFVLMALLDE
ncbi:MAG TPA: hypothetical protein VID67_07795 [Rhizomicrobium sp.]|jgi:hypothetical protein